MHSLQTIAVTIVVLAILTILGLGASSWLKELIEVEVEGELENELRRHEERIRQVRESQAAEYRDEIARLNLEAVKAFQLLMVADSDIRHLVRLLDYSPDFREFDVSDIKRFFTAHDVPVEEQDRILRLWRNNRRGAVEELERLLGQVRVDSALNSWSEAHQYLLSDALDVSPATRSRSRRLLNLLHDLRFEVETSGADEPEQSDREVEDEILETLDELSAAVKRHFADHGFRAGSEGITST